MKNEETGEFELVLGNRQLLSGFFVVVILFAVFFVMGYIVGRNTSPPPRLANAADSSPALPSLAETRAQTPPQTSQTAESPKDDPVKQTASEQAPVTQPERQPETKPESTPAATPPAELAPGTYLQVMSVKQPEAEVVARSLKDKGFPASLTPGPNGRTRVLVGPYADTAALGKAKAELENAGFHPIVKK